MHRLLLLWLALAMSAPVVAAAPEEAAMAGLPHVTFPAPHRVASGRLQAGDIATLKRAGIRQVIDLSLDSETPGFDEAAAVRAAGIGYHNLPIRDAGDLTQARVAQFERLLIDAGDQPTLVHCASSNRVGAMIALRAALIDGRSTEAALAEGRRWGLKSLEPAVRERLQAWSSDGSDAAAAPPAR
ncbi:MAG TPA: sulfur transferase domain-containing protein [Rhodanobacter sp.]|nr:sulfur transferase domain-containing protein [Rhodanobacter sp.]